MGIGISSRATECLSPISGESLDMLGVKAMAERMGHDLVRHHPLMPGGSKPAQPFLATCCLEHSLHVAIMTILSCLCKTITLAGSRGPPHELNVFALENPRLFYDLLFTASAQTLLKIASDPKHLGAEIGVIGILHTWGQNLLLNPHS